MTNRKWIPAFYRDLVDAVPRYSPTAWVSGRAGVGHGYMLQAAMSGGAGAPLANGDVVDFVWSEIDDRLGTRSSGMASCVFDRGIFRLAPSVA